MKTNSNKRVTRSHDTAPAGARAAHHVAKTPFEDRSFLRCEWCELEIDPRQGLRFTAGVLRDNFKLLAPIMVSKFIPGARRSSLLAEELVRQFMKSLRPAQMEWFVGVLSQEQMVVVHEIHAAYCERERERAERNGTVNGASGTRGTTGHSGARHP